MPEPSFRQTLCPRAPKIRQIATPSAVLRRPARALALAALLAASACSDPVGLREAEGRAEATATGITEPTRAPSLLPIGPLLAQADATSLSDATAEGLVAQGAALRAQAAAIRSDAQAAPQIDPQIDPPQTDQPPTEPQPTDPQTVPPTAPQTTP